jgi:CheY-like chemotaxis protein
MHGGSVSVRSDGVDQGASFEIRLPLAHAESAVKPVAAGDAIHLHRVLVVDDNRDGADLMAALLQKDGHEVAAVYSSREALDLVHRFKPEIVLLDIGLPEIDGYELARRIHADPTLQPVKLIAITGYGQEEDKARAFSAGFSAHLLKPVEFARLRQLLAGS